MEPTRTHLTPRPILGVLAGLFALALTALARTWTGLAEAYAATLGPALGWSVSRLSGLVPFALSEWLLLLLLPLILLGALRLGRRARRLGWSRPRLLAGAALGLLNLAGWILAVFSIGWGLYYARPPLEERWQLHPVRSEQLGTLAEWLVDRTNERYVALHGSEDAGHPTRTQDIVAVDRALEQAYAQLASELAPETGVGWHRSGVKRPHIAPLMNRLGISGFFFPWSGEANVNGELPAISLVHAMAHEKAHQRGFAPEDEANFMAILAGTRSGESLSNYAALLFAQRQLLRRLARDDFARGQELVRRRHAGVQRDVDDLHRYWEQFRGPAQDFAHRTNDLYLKSNRVEGGVASYQGSLELILRLAATHGESVLLPPVGESKRKGSTR